MQTDLTGISPIGSTYYLLNSVIRKAASLSNVLQHSLKLLNDFEKLKLWKDCYVVEVGSTFCSAEKKEEN